VILEGVVEFIALLLDHLLSIRIWSNGIALTGSECPPKLDTESFV
jgi:hypothetical protein